MAPEEIAGPRYRGLGISKWARAGVLGKIAGKSLYSGSTVPFPGKSIYSCKTGCSKE